MQIISKLSSAQKQHFFRLVQEEWNEDFEVLERERKPQIWVALVNENVGVGMAIFKKHIPESEKVLKKAQSLFDIGAVYLGYFVVEKSLRGKGLGSRFLQTFLQQFTERQFWLVIEDVELEKFYKKNGFKVFATVGKEKILVQAD